MTNEIEKLTDEALHKQIVEWHTKCWDYCQNLPEEKRKDFEKAMNDTIENVNPGWKKALESTYKSGGDYSWLDTGLKPDD